ncbi:PGPGW domain-containing protein [Pseudoalteromonas sp.]|uniref:PGPGW domain-containing protein n=1 Tax=Pseudoalteromonas sp. TaxID=53249 RepID=UPI00356831CD
MKKMLLLFSGGLFMLLGVLFVIIPGPSLLFFIVGLMCFSCYYPKARHSLALCQRALTKSCAYLDKKLAR